MNKIACIAFITGLSVASVGEMLESPPEPYPWWLPPLVLLSMMVAPAISGYLAGRDDERAEG